VPTDDDRCPCGSGDTYGACCARFHRGEAAPTPEALMRSRYSAFVVGDTGYLLATWDPAHRPADLVLDPDTEWLRLVVVRAEGGPFDARGTVEFEAHHRTRGRRGVQREVSEFVRRGGTWAYVTGSAG
jgi:SEC-C motif-containing protein